jgi:hypothetical protein
MVLGGDLIVPVTCPKCGAPGSVAWERLGHRLRCPKCQVWFHVERQGQSVLWRSEYPFSCPRCRHKGALAPNSPQAECPRCRLPLFAGPSGRLYSAPELAALEERSKAGRQAVRCAERRADARSLSPRQTRVLAASASALIVLLVGGAIAFWQRPHAANAQAAALSRQCLDGDWKDAVQFVSDDDLQRTEFRRWQIMHFASIQAKVRPGGDRVRIEVAPVHEGDDLRVLRVTLSSPFMGERRHVQYWSRAADNWHFNASMSLQDPHNVRLQTFVAR